MKLVFRFSLGMSCTLVLCAGSVVAQMDPGTGSPPKDNKRRARTATARDAKKETAQKPTAEPEASQTSEDSVEKAVEKPVPADPLAVLREQIDSASNGQEKGRLQLKLVDQLLAAGKKQDAINELLAIVNEARFDPQGFYNAGNALARLGETDGAVNAYRKAIEQRKGGYSKALNNLGVVLMRLGHWQQAHDALTKALRLESFRYAEASYNLGRLYATQGEIDLALREWRRAVYVDPGHTAASQAIAQAGKEEIISVVALPLPDKEESSRRNRSDDPQTNVRSSGSLRTASSSKVLTVDPATYNHLQRARSASERGKHDEALQNYRAVISRMGGYFGPANLELSYVLIGLKQPEEALAYLREVTTREGNRYPISFYHLGRIYEFRGDLELAVEAYDQAAKHYADNPQFLLDISRVREKRGDYTGALAAMQDYLTAMDQRGLKPNWSEERLASLRQKIAASPK
jgi:tetratricopeptide (TPR) repeat protein